ncbi:16S rRNA (cytidine(1402)-2'-O)-methyltransferase [Acidobacteriia bacterium AH_259_A11_L15]|nr:16S rRNA (cytidine(1402)-2'-O)-methyltransferase [Acidobacteriia bacterium AH_259_A11_L15]
MGTQVANYPAPRRSENGGCLYLVATPIGNLEDITLRALRVLREVDLIACEDTRQTAKLLNFYGIHKKALSYHQHNEVVRAAEIVLEMEQGARVALVSDAGTPGISDPGDHLISLAIRHAIPIIPVPGATAFGAALMASGLPCAHFHFVGFLPPRRTQRRKALKELAGEPGTLIFYEAPHRILESLADMAAVLGNRHVVLAREVTKLHEEFLRGRLEQVLPQIKKRALKGEITLLVAPADERAVKPARRKTDSLRALVARLQKQKKLDLKAALKQVARELGLSRSEAYRRLQEEKALEE